MIDVDAILREYLVAQPALTAICANRVYASVDMPAGTNAESLPALVFTSQVSPSYPSKLLRGPVTFRAYGTESTARQLDRALFDVFHDHVTSSIKAAHLELGGQLLEEPNTGWYFVLSTYRVVMANP